MHTFIFSLYLYTHTLSMRVLRSLKLFCRSWTLPLVPLLLPTSSNLHSNLSHRGRNRFSLTGSLPPTGTVLWKATRQLVEARQPPLRISRLRRNSNPPGHRHNHLLHVQSPSSPFCFELEQFRAICLRRVCIGVRERCSRFRVIG